MADKPLSNVEIYDRIASALDALGTEPCATKVGNNILNSARSILAGCLLAMTRATTPTADLWPPKKTDVKRD